MNKIILIAFGILAIAGGVFFFTQQQKVNETDPANTQAESNPSENFSSENETPTNTGSPTSGQAASLAELAQGGAKRCEVTIDMSSEDPNMSDYFGVFYSDGQGKYKSEVWQQSKPESKYFTLVTNPWVYTWTNYDSRGIKVQSTSTDSNRPPSELNTNNFDQPYNFDCSNWPVDSTMFEPPANITFSDMPQFAQ